MSRCFTRLSWESLLHRQMHAALSSKIGVGAAWGRSTNARIWRRYWAVLTQCDRARYSDSVEEEATKRCCEDFQSTAAWLSRNAYPVWDLRVATSLAKSASQNPHNWFLSTVSGTGFLRSSRHRSDWPVGAMFLRESRLRSN